MEKQFMKRALEMARIGMNSNQGGPFGCVIVKDGKILAEAHNLVTSVNDPTAHAEVVAIREACQTLNSFQLEGCEIYASCEPCPMCLGAIYWARPDAVYFAGRKEDAANAGFDDSFIYHEIDLSPEQRSIPMHPVECSDAQELFREWVEKEDKIDY